MSQMHYYKLDGQLAEPQKKTHICRDVPIHLRNKKWL